MDKTFDFSDKDLYNTKYLPLCTNKKRLIVLVWGAWSGKSSFVIQKEIALTFHWVEKNRVLCVRKTKESVKNSIYAECLHRISEWELNSYFNVTKSPLYIKNNLTGNDIIFSGLDDVEKLKSIHWVTRIVIEEATELTYNDYMQLNLRLRGVWANYQITMMCNPVHVGHWINTEIWQKWSNDDVELLHTTALDNRWVWEAFLKELEKLKETNPSLYKVYALGEWGVIEGLIFEYNVIQSIPKEAELLWYWMDFGFTNDPTALVALYKYNGELIFDEIVYRTRMTNGEIITLCKQECVPACTIYADSSDPKSIEEIRLWWVAIDPAKKWPDSVRFWINLMQSFKINVTSSSINWLKEFGKYAWKNKDGKYINEPSDAFNHFIDACRYVAMMKLQNQNDKFWFVA